MDDKWFKAQQKKVGATAEDIARERGLSRVNVSHILNGRQRMSIDWAHAFSKVLKQPVSVILEKAGVVDPATARQLSPGFAESDAAPFDLAGADTRRAAVIAEAFGARPGIDIWKITTASMALAGYLPGDYVLVDTHQAERVRAGDVVIAQIYSPRGAKTVLRRWMPPVLVAHAAPTEDEPVYVVDNDNVVIRGKVTASWRT